MSRIDESRMSRLDMISEMAGEELQQLAQMALRDWAEYEANLRPLIEKALADEYSRESDLTVAHCYHAMLARVPTGWGKDSSSDEEEPHPDEGREWI